jgi:hypothetical protein
MTSSGMLRRVAFVRTGVSEERIASIRVTRLGELGRTVVITTKRSTKCRLLQEPHGHHDGDYEECRILGCYTVWLL